MRVGELLPFLWHIHTACNRDQDRDREQMGCMKLCGSFHITPEPGQGLIPIVCHGSSNSPCACLGTSYAQCEYTTEVKTFLVILSPLLGNYQESMPNFTAKTL